MTNKECILMIERKLVMLATNKGNVKLSDIHSVISSAIRELAIEEAMLTPVEKFIFVEDGSIDTDELQEKLETSNPEIKMVIYRQGSRPPELVEVKK
jgi:hypothetical protein